MFNIHKIQNYLKSLMHY